MLLVFDIVKRLGSQEGCHSLAWQQLLAPTCCADFCLLFSGKAPSRSLRAISAKAFASSPRLCFLLPAFIGSGYNWFPLEVKSSHHDHQDSCRSKYSARAFCPAHSHLGGPFSGVFVWQRGRSEASLGNDLSFIKRGIDMRLFRACSPGRPPSFLLNLPSAQYKVVVRLGGGQVHLCLRSTGEVGCLLPPPSS